MKQYIKENLLFISGVTISVIAEYFSIYGLSQLFSGAFISVIIMASALGIGKLVIAGTLKVKWSTYSNVLRYYLLGALIVLSFVTSLGIYGFLSHAYSVTKTKNEAVEKKLMLVQAKKSHFESNLVQMKDELVGLNTSIEQMRKGLTVENQTQQIVKGQVITNIISTNKTGLQNQLDKAIVSKELLDNKILSTTDSIQRLELIIIETNQSNDAGSELGSLRYISTMSGIPIDSVVNYLLLLLIFVFDPLALCLLWAYYSLPVTNTTNQSPNDVKPTEPEQTTPKKKRGRPRKQKPGEIIDAVMNTPSITVENDTLKKKV